MDNVVNQDLLLLRENTQNLEVKMLKTMWSTEVEEGAPSEIYFHNEKKLKVERYNIDTRLNSRTRTMNDIPRTNEYFSFEFEIVNLSPDGHVYVGVGY